MRSEAGFRRLVGFSDAIVAIAITLLILPLVDSANGIGAKSVGAFLQADGAKLFAFGLSFVVIGSFWWGHHQMFERARGYNSLMVAGMFLWMASIVFLPFPTELLGSAKNASTAVHALYIGTLLVTAFAALMQQWAIVTVPALREDPEDDSLTIDDGAVNVLLMAVALVGTVAFPSLGLWPLLVLLLTRPLVRLAGALRRRAGSVATE
jgi:uncharacterized membrane protein